METIFALSSGMPPAAIAVVRVSGPRAGAALEGLAGSLPEPRRAVAATLRAADGSELDRALVLWLPGPGTATGEDIAELHLHGGRAVIAAVEAALYVMPGLRKAEAGEFTRRAFTNGRIDLAEAEGLADLLAAETELQRRAAVAMAGGALSRQVADWRERVLALAAHVEAILDFADEDDVAALPDNFAGVVTELRCDISTWLAQPRAEPLREGFRVVLAGPPNAGKSTLFNALVESEAAITAPTPGTTRDIIERPVAIDGVPFTFVDTAGLRDVTADAIESAGIARARTAVGRADLVLWLDGASSAPTGAWVIAAKSDLGAATLPHIRHALSAKTGAGMAEFKKALVAHAKATLPRPGNVALNKRQHALLTEAAEAMQSHADPLLQAEALRQARSAFDRLVGYASTEDMLDTLFSGFCIGK